MPAWLGSGVGALFRACRWLPLAVSSEWVRRKITSSYEDANPVLGIHPHDLITPQTLLLHTIPLGVGLQHEFGGWGHMHLVHSRSLGMRGQDPPAPGPERGWKLGLPLSRQRCSGGGDGQPSVPTAARVFWGPCGSRCSCWAWQEPGSGPVLRNAAGHCPSPWG